MVKSSIKTLFVIFAFGISPLVVAQQLYIVQIMGQFVQSNYAASQCIKPNQKTLSSFLTNFKVLSIRTNRRIEKRNPEQSEQQIIASLKQQTGKVEKAISEAIRSNGCSAPRIQNLLRRFEIQANLKL